MDAFEISQRFQQPDFLTVHMAVLRNYTQKKLFNLKLLAD